MISPLLTDLYQLTMAYGYWKLNMHNQEAVFQLIFRNNPFRGNYSVACGLETVIEFLQDWHFAEEDLAYLEGLCSANGEPLFTRPFLDYLGQLRFSCDVDAIPEGTVVFPHEPLLRVTGPLLQCQLIESTVLNIINFQTLIATKAARVCQVAGKQPVLEFGLRRAQGPDGALSASRAAYIGGCEATSNVLAGKIYDIPVRGTHAHSWVTAFPDEMSAFLAYADVMPHNCVLLVDTYDTLTGVKNAIEVGKKLREKGLDLLGIRLDSGDLALLSIAARKLLDEAGFEKTQIVASNSLDEYVIQSLHEQKAEISIWGVGTSLVTAFDQPALDGVYKLSALRDKEGSWQYKIKLSDMAVKISNPGIHQVRRFFSDTNQVMDVIYDEALGIPELPEMIMLGESADKMKLTDFDGCMDLIVPIYRQGQLVGKRESIHAVRKFAKESVTQFVKMNGTKSYPVGLENKTYALKQNLIKKLVEEKNDRK